MKNYEAIVRSNLCKVLERDPTQAVDIDLQASLFDDLGLTSLDLIVMMTAICREAGTSLTRFSQDDMLQILNPGAIIALLASKEQARTA